MKKVLLFAICLLLAFYVGWPLWSAYKIHSALESNDTQTLESKVDFASVRASLKPVVTSEVERALDRAAGRGGGFGQILGGAVKQQLGPQLVETILNSFVTPKQVSQVYSRRGDIRELVAEKMGKRLKKGDGDLPAGDASKEATTADATAAAAEAQAADVPRPREKLGIANIKRFALTGPLGFEVGLARDKAATVADVTAQIGFKNFDWKLLGLVPKAR